MVSTPVADHETFMRRAIALTAKTPDLPFGAVIVDRETRTVVAEGWNRGASDRTAHGEMDALRTLHSSAAHVKPAGLTLYTTAEPCPMCMGAILWSEIGEVVFGVSIETLRRLGWRQIAISAEEVVRRSPGWQCHIVRGVLEAECEALFAGIGESRS